MIWGRSPLAIVVTRRSPKLCAGTMTGFNVAPSFSLSVVYHVFPAPSAGGTPHVMVSAEISPPLPGGAVTVGFPGNGMLVYAGATPSTLLITAPSIWGNGLLLGSFRSPPVPGAAVVPRPSLEQPTATAPNVPAPRASAVRRDRWG